MRLPNPYTNPNFPGFSSCAIHDNSVVIQDELTNNRVIQVSNGAQFYSLSLVYQDLLQDEYDMLVNFLAKVKRENSTIDVLLPQIENLTFKLNTYTAKAGCMGNQLIIPNVTSISGNLRLNQYMQIGSHYKLYQVTGSSLQGTNLVLDVYPDLFITTNGTEVVNFKTPVMTTRFVDPSKLTGTPLTTDGYYSSLSLELRECSQ